MILNKEQIAKTRGENASAWTRSSDVTIRDLLDTIEAKDAEIAELKDKANRLQILVERVR